LSAERIAQQLSSLREAGRSLRRRPRREILESLEGVLEEWRDPASQWRVELERRHPEATGFAPAMVHSAIEVGLQHWTSKALREVVKSELGDVEELPAGSPQGFPATAVILAGSIPMPTLLALLSPLLLHSPVLAKPASRDPVTPELVLRSVAGIDPQLGACMALADVPAHDPDCTRALLQAECVVAMGSDETLAGLSASLPDGHRWVAHGHRLSIAVLGEEATAAPEIESVAEGLARDTALWDQLGCLSPIAVYVVGGGTRACQRMANALATALAAAETRWPLGRIPVEAAAQRAHEIEVARMRAATGPEVSLYEGSNGRWAVVCEGDAQSRAAPLHRFVRVYPVEDLAALEVSLRPLAPHLAGVALAGFGKQQEAAEHVLSGLGASRLCAPGQLQAPPLGWRREGRPVLLPLARIPEWENAKPAASER